MHSGILLIDKPAGLTSFGVVRQVRRILGVRKIGHLGTLDPFATGLLPLCLGEATKLVPFLMPEAKTYRAQVKLGEATDTQDLTGAVVARSAILPTPAEVREAAARFVGEIEQVPPMYSALHHQGRRLYELARRGEVVDLKPRRVTIYRLEVAEAAGAEVTMTVECSAGTYIRTLAADLGAALGCGAHLKALRRLAVGSFKVDAALTPEALEGAAPEEVRSRIIPPAECLPGLRPVHVGSLEAEDLRQGRALPWAGTGLTAGEQVRVLEGPELVAVAGVRQQGQGIFLAPLRVFNRAMANSRVRLLERVT
jgi:tRNA pseudouridine55 synthase